MKKLISIILFALAAAVCCGQGAATLAQEGDSLYRLGDYQSAAERYEAALATGNGSAEVYYNLGNAYYRAEQTGLAILNYERALRLRPTMSDARENLEMAYGRTTDRIAVLPKWFAARWIDILCTRVTPAGWRTVWLVLLALLAAAVVGVMAGRGLRLRRWSLAGGVVALALLVCCTALLISTTKRWNAHADAIVMHESVAIKGSPEQRSVDKMILHEGTRVHISESLQGWEKITIADGTTGWCPTEAIERI